MNIIIAFLISVLTLFTVPPYATYDNNDTTIDTPIAELNDNTLREVFEDSSIFDSEQLVTNGDFSDGTTGWTKTPTATYSVSDGVMKFNPTTQYDSLNSSPLDTVIGNKYYYVGSIKSNTNTGRFQLGSTLVSTIANNVFTLYGSFFIATGTAHSIILYENQTVAGEYYLDYAYAFNISTLQANKQYSPLYETTFDLMSDGEIKEQMDAFISKPYEFIDYDTLGWYPTQSELDYYYSLYRELIDFDGAIITYLEYDLHDKIGRAHV